MKCLKKTIEKNGYLRRFVISRFNIIDVNDNKCILENINSRNNSILISGQGNTFYSYKNSLLNKAVIYVSGGNNIIDVGESTSIIGDNEKIIHINGKNNEISIGSACKLNKTSFFINGNDNKITVGSNCSFIHTYFHIEGNGNRIMIGNNCSFHGRPGYPNTLFSDEGKTIRIDDDAMLAHGIRIRDTDSHCILDLHGNRLNPPEDVYIGRHCWIGLDVVILKGCYVSDHSVVAARAVCIHRYEESHCIIGGNPAKVIKRDIDWKRELPII